MSGHHRRPDLDDETARQMVRGFLDAGTVTPVVDQRILVHEPSGTTFESLLQLAVFHGGWTATHGAGEGDERATDAGRVCLL